jgi:hypothetical protein
MSKRKTHERKTEKQVQPEQFSLLAPSAINVFDIPSWIAPFVIFAALLVLYIATLAPSVVGGDSGGLTAAAITGGVPHPPGYPLFAMLARIFAAVPIGDSPAWRVNLLTAVSTAAAASILCAVVQLWTKNALAAAASAAMFGTNRVVWLHALSAEVFGLNAVFVGSAFFLWLKAERTSSSRFVFALAFVSGLAMCNHHTFAFVGLPLLLRSIWVARQRLGMLGFGIVSALGLLGLLPYLYLVFASSSSAAVSWGDETTCLGLITHILRLDFGTFSMGQVTSDSAFSDTGTFTPALWTLSGKSVSRFTILGPALAAAGLFIAAVHFKERKVAATIGIVWAFYIVAFALLCNVSPNGRLYLNIVERFSIQADFVLAIATGPAFAMLLSQLQPHLPYARRLYIALCLPILVLMFGALTQGGRVNQRSNRVFVDFARTAASSLPQQAILVTIGDHVTGAMSYFLEVEKLRPDVIHLDREMLTFPWYKQRKIRLHPDFNLPEGNVRVTFKKLLEDNPSRPLVVIDDIYAQDESWTEGYKLVSEGLVHPIVPNDKYPTFEQWRENDRKAIGEYTVIPALQFPENSWEHAIGELVLKTEGTRAHVALVYSLERNKDPDAALRCAALLEDVIATTGGDPKLHIRDKVGGNRFAIGAGAWRDLGVCYEILARKDPAYTARVAVAVQRFMENAPPDDPGVAAAKKYLEMYRQQVGESP